MRAAAGSSTSAFAEAMRIQCYLPSHVTLPEGMGEWIRCQVSRSMSRQVALANDVPALGRYHSRAGIGQAAHEQIVCGLRKVVPERLRDAAVRVGQALSRFRDVGVPA